METKKALIKAGFKEIMIYKRGFPQYFYTDGIRFYRARRNEYGRFTYLGDTIIMDEVSNPL